jgi:hypothetical protein
MDALDERMEEYRAQAERQRARAALHTRADAWRTAAVMTCLLPPVGLPFGVSALVALRGIAGKIESDRETDTQRALFWGRALVLAGSAIGALCLLLSCGAMVLLGLRFIAFFAGFMP